MAAARDLEILEAKKEADEELVKELETSNLAVNNSQDNAESEIELGEWILPIGLGLVILLLLGYMVLSRKN